MHSENKNILPIMDVTVGEVQCVRKSSLQHCRFNILQHPIRVPLLAGKRNMVVTICMPQNEYHVIWGFLTSQSDFSGVQAQTEQINDLSS